MNIFAKYMFRTFQTYGLKEGQYSIAPHLLSQAWGEALCLTFRLSYRKSGVRSIFAALPRWRLHMSGKFPEMDEQTKKPLLNYFETLHEWFTRPSREAMGTEISFLLKSIWDPILSVLLTRHFQNTFLLILNASNNMNRYDCYNI